MPTNLAQLLFVVSTLLEYGHHLLATIERRATLPGFSLLARLFGTANLRVILAHLHRGILRATAFEALLRRRAATGRDVTVPPLRIATPRSTDSKRQPPQDPRDAQPRRQAKPAPDAPIDPDHLPTLEEIEAEIRRRPYGRTVSDICGDLGVVPGLCTSALWREIMGAIVFYQGSMVTYLHNMQHRSHQWRQEQAQAPAAQQTECTVPPHPYQVLGFKIGEPPVDPFRTAPLPAEPRDDVPLPEEHAAAPPDATGPPPRADTTLAA